MTSEFIPALSFVATLGCGLIAGVFYAFSTFVMRALCRVPPAEGMAAMQSINVAVINPMFLGVFLGTALACAATGVAALVRWDKPGAGLLLTGSLLYIAGTFGVTLVFNVPLNNALATITREDTDAAGRWADYASRWTTWNHVRTAAALAATACLTVAFRMEPA